LTVDSAWTYYSNALSRNESGSSTSYQAVVEDGTASRLKVYPGSRLQNEVLGSMGSAKVEGPGTEWLYHLRERSPSSTNVKGNVQEGESYGARAIAASTTRAAHLCFSGVYVNLQNGWIPNLHDISMIAQDFTNFAGVRESPCPRAKKSAKQECRGKEQEKEEEEDGRIPLLLICYLAFSPFRS